MGDLLRSFLGKRASKDDPESRCYHWYQSLYLTGSVADGRRGRRAPKIGVIVRVIIPWAEKRARQGKLCNPALPT